MLCGWAIQAQHAISDINMAAPLRGHCTVTHNSSFAIMQEVASAH